MREPQDQESSEIRQLLDWFPDNDHYDLITGRAIARAATLLRESTGSRYDFISVSSEDLIQDGIVRILEKHATGDPRFFKRLISLQDLSYQLAKFAENVLRELLKKRRVRRHAGSKLRTEIERRGLRDYLEGKS